MAALLMFALFFGLPILWFLMAPSKTNVGLSIDNPLAFGSFGNYVNALDRLWHYGGGLFTDWIVNSAYFSVAIVALAMALCCTAGYALAHYEFVGRKVVLIATMVAMVTPGAATVLPLFLEVNLVHLVNTPLAVILPSSFFPFGVYLMYTYFATTLPVELVQAARVDGCSEWAVFRRVALPLARPMVGLVAFFAFVAQWNNFFLIEVMIPGQNGQTLQVGLSYLEGLAFGAQQGVAPNMQILRPEVAMAGIVLAVPVVVFFFFVQKRLVRGLLSGYGVQ